MESFIIIIMIEIDLANYVYKTEFMVNYVYAQLLNSFEQTIAINVISTECSAYINIGICS